MERNEQLVFYQTWYSFPHACFPWVIVHPLSGDEKQYEPKHFWLHLHLLYNVEFLFICIFEHVKYICLVISLWLKEYFNNSFKKSFTLLAKVHSINNRSCIFSMLHSVELMVPKTWHNSVIGKWLETSMHYFICF